MHVPRSLRGSALLALCCTSASCSSTPEGSVLVVRDAELDTGTPKTLVLEELKGGVRRELSRKPWAAGTLDLGSLSRSDSGSFRAYGLNAAGVVSHSGKTLEIAYDSLDSARIPLFVAPVDRFVHLPGTVDSSIQGAPLLATDRVLILPGQASILTAYDLLALTSVNLMTNPKAASIAAVGSKLLLVSDSAVHSYDLSTSTDTALTSLPDAADVSGGRGISDGAAHTYVAGPTRGTPSSTVWYWGGETTVARTSLSTPRANAAVVFASGLGLVVLGGDVENAEVVTPGASQAFSLPAPTKDVRVACSTGGTHLLTIRASGVIDTFDASCRQTCPLESWPVPVMKPKAASLVCVRGRVLYATADDAGLTHVFAVAKDSATEIPLPTGRKGGTLFSLPTEHVGLVGGATTIDVVSAPETPAPR